MWQQFFDAASRLCRTIRVGRRALLARLVRIEVRPTFGVIVHVKGEQLKHGQVAANRPGAPLWAIFRAAMPRMCKLDESRPMPQILIPNGAYKRKTTWQTAS